MHRKPQAAWAPGGGGQLNHAGGLPASPASQAAGDKRSTAFPHIACLGPTCITRWEAPQGSLVPSSTGPSAPPRVRPLSFPECRLSRRHRTSTGTAT